MAQHVWVDGETNAARSMSLCIARVAAGSRARWRADRSQLRPTQSFVSDLQAAVSSIGKQIEVLEAPTGRHIDTAFARLAQKAVDALLVGPGPMLNNRRVQVATLATYHRVPAIYFWREAAEAGGLMSYGSNIEHRPVLKGEKPADLPFVQSTKFEFVINLNTARAFGQLPPGLLAIAPRRRGRLAGLRSSAPTPNHADVWGKLNGTLRFDEIRSDGTNCLKCGCGRSRRASTSRK
jgi:hypothetical protein